MAGGFAGAISRTCTAPLDRLKIHLITYVAEATKPSTSLLKRAPRMSLMEGVRTIYHSGGGIRAFFVGNGLNVAKIFPESAIKFWSFEKAKVALSKVEGLEDKNHISTASRFAAGGIAGIVSQFAIYPVETLKIRIQSQPFTHVNERSSLNSTVSKTVNSAIVTTARQMYKTGGLMAFWPGLVSQSYRPTATFITQHVMIYICHTRL